MKMKVLATFGAASILAACGTTAPAYAADRVEASYYDHGKKRGHYKRNKHNRRVIIVHPRHDRYYPRYGYSRNIYSRYPSYYRGRCYNDYRTVIVRDPYTGRLVCMPRYDYDRYRLQINIRLQKQARWCAGGSHKAALAGSKPASATILEDYMGYDSRAHKELEQLQKKIEALEERVRYLELDEFRIKYRDPNPFGRDGGI